jgi:hypothetical protein
MIKPVVALFMSLLPANSAPQIHNVDVKIELIRDYEERLPGPMMDSLCRQRNCDYTPRQAYPYIRSYPERSNWREYQEPRPARSYDYQDFRSPYRYQYER